jgi:hypothetical protein
MRHIRHVLADWLERHDHTLDDFADHPAEEAPREAERARRAGGRPTRAQLDERATRAALYGHRGRVDASPIDPPPRAA